MNLSHNEVKKQHEQGLYKPLKDWESFSDVIESMHHQYDGFVILHGTDTMAYSASAVSFMFQNLNKPIIFTGSQLPIGVHRTDAKENLITSIEIEDFLRKE